MRESLRGLLLSALFFALLIGGAPTLADASSPTSVTQAHKLKEQEGPCQNGGVLTQEGCVSHDYFNQHNDCYAAGKRATIGGVIGGLGVLGMLIPEPITSGAGMGAMIGGTIGVIWGGIGLLANDCF